MLRHLVLLPLLVGIGRACPDDEVLFPDDECGSCEVAAAQASLRCHLKYPSSGQRKRAQPRTTHLPTSIIMWIVRYNPNP